MTIKSLCIRAGFCAAVAVLCASAQAPRRIEVQGHRGARALRPENTLPAFRYALELGVDVLELDLGVSRDGVLVVSHDPEVNPVICRGPGGAAVPPKLALFSLPYSKIREFDCGGSRHPDYSRQVLVPGTPMPRLEDVLALLREPRFARVALNVETKISPDRPDLAPPPEKFAELVLEALRKSGLQPRAVIQSFDYRTLRAARKLAPGIRTAALVPFSRTTSSKGDFVGWVREAQAQIISPEKRLVTPERVRAAHDAGLRVIPWTANEPAEWDALVAAGVDGIITDDPAALIEYLKRRGLR